MSKREPAALIESTVGASRHPTDHIGRAESSRQTVYVLHSRQCVDSTPDLRDCEYSLALDDGIDADAWEGFEDRPVVLRINPEWGDLEPIGAP